MEKKLGDVRVEDKDGTQRERGKSIMCKGPAAPRGALAQAKPNKLTASDDLPA